MKGSYRYQKVYNGVRIDLTASDPDELDEKVRQRKNEIDAGLSLHSAKITVKTWCEEWVNAYKVGKVSEPYCKDIQNYLTSYIYPDLGAMVLKDVRPIMIQKLLNKHSGKSMSLLTKLRAVLNDAFKQAIIDQYITVNPVSGIKLPKAKAGTHRALTDAETELMLRVCDKHYAGLWIKMMYYCGLRPQETATLTWGDIDETHKRINVKLALKKSGKVGEPKTKSGIRAVPMPENYFAELVASRPADADKNNLIFSTEGEKNTEHGGKPLDHKAMLRRWTSIKREMDIAAGAKVERNKITASVIAPDLQLYCLRHTYCTNLMRAGVPINTAKSLMGHNDLRMIAKVYGHHTDDQSDVAASLLETFYNDKKRD